MITKERFIQILKEEGIVDKDLIERLWNTRPDDATTEGELRLIAKVFLGETSHGN